MLAECEKYPNFRLATKTYCKSLSQNNHSLLEAKLLDSKNTQILDDPLKIIIYIDSWPFEILNSETLTLEAFTNDDLTDDLSSFGFNLIKVSGGKYFLRSVEGENCFNGDVEMVECDLEDEEQMFDAYIGLNYLQLKNSRGGFLDLTGDIATFDGESDITSTKIGLLGNNTKINIPEPEG